MTIFQPLRETLKELPVHGIIPEVVKNVMEGDVTVVAARTGSGKSMMLPSALADATGEQVVVLVPRRFLATDAATNVAQLSGTTLGAEVGFALGQVNGERSLHTPDTKLLFCTYGYALRSGLINRARTIVLDEVHEGDEHISLARAVLHERKKAEPGLRLLEMSATVNAPRQASFWKDVAPTSIHEATGSEHACDLVHESPLRAGHKGRSLEAVVMGLLRGEDDAEGRIKSGTHTETTGDSLDDFAAAMAREETQGHGHDHGSRGIMVFRGGIKEVNTTVRELKRLIAQEGMRNVEVVGIHSGTPSYERDEAREPPPPGWRKIIVGTNVIESGVNLRWVDAGVSDGVRKRPYHREDTGADALVAEDLPQSGITQQMGRINRDPEATGFARGIFILHAKNKFEERAKENGPAIDRESLLAPAFHAASLGYDPTRLKWDISPEHRADLPKRLAQAKEDLKRLELIDDDWTLTDEGEFINTLPVSPEAGAMLNEAHRMDVERLRTGKPARVLRDAIILAAINEVKDLKKDNKRIHSTMGDIHKTSDVIDGMNAFRAIRAKATQAGIVPSVVHASNESNQATATAQEKRELKRQREALDTICDEYNMSVNGYIEVAQLVGEISKRLSKKPGVDVKASVDDSDYNAERYNDLKRCILNGRVNQVFQCEQGMMRDLMRDDGKRKRDNGEPFYYDIAESSIVKHVSDGTMVSGYLREVTPKRKAEEREAHGRQRDSKKPAQKTNGEPIAVVTKASIIPNEVFMAWARARAERGFPILAQAGLKGDRLHAHYAGRAEFELPVNHHTARDAGHLAIDSLHGQSVDHAMHGHSKKHKKGKGNRAGGGDSWAESHGQGENPRQGFGID